MRRRTVVLIALVAAGPSLRGQALPETGSHIPSRDSAEVRVLARALKDTTLAN